MHDVTCGCVSLLFYFFNAFLCHLQQKVVAQQQEMNSLAQKRTRVDDQSALMKELMALREQMLNNSQELKVGGTNIVCRCRQQKMGASLCGGKLFFPPVT